MPVSTYVKSFIAGMAALVASVCAIVAITIATFYLTEMRRAGSAGIGAVSIGIPVWWFVIPTAAFVAGFGWEFRRAIRQLRVKPKP
jgi:ABC-type dipeptide/oligopeptide/nickel transport system permease component